MLGHVETLLIGIAANPFQRLSELPLLTAAERHQLLVEWNNTQSDALSWNGLGFGGQCVDTQPSAVGRGRGSGTVRAFSKLVGLRAFGPTTHQNG